jgi:hypothetical protein
VEAGMKTIKDVNILKKDIILVMMMTEILYLQKKINQRNKIIKTTILFFKPIFNNRDFIII